MVQEVSSVHMALQGLTESILLRYIIKVHFVDRLKYVARTQSNVQHQQKNITAKYVYLLDIIVVSGIIIRLQPNNRHNNSSSHFFRCIIKMSSSMTQDSPLKFHEIEKALQTA